MTFDEVAAIWQPYVDGVQGGVGQGVAARRAALRLAGDSRRAARRPVSRSGCRWFKREVLWAADHPLRRRSSPRVRRPSRSCVRRRSASGATSTAGTAATRRATSHPTPTSTLILAPFAFKSQGFVGRTAARHLAKEPGKWERRTGGRAIVVRPSEAIVAIEFKGMTAMSDTNLGRQIHETGDRDRRATRRRRCAATIPAVMAD